MPRRRAPWMSEHDRHESERASREKAERKARGSRLYAVLAWRADSRYSGKDVWRWFKRRPDAEKWAAGFNDGHGVAVRDYTLLSDASAEWIPERAAKLVSDFLRSSSSGPSRHHEKKSPAQLQREIDEALSGEHGKSINPEYLRKTKVAAQLADDAWLRGGLDAMDAELKRLRRDDADPVIIGELERLYHNQMIRVLPKQ